MLTRRKCLQEECNGHIEVSRSGIVKEVYFVDEEGYINFNKSETQIVPMSQEYKARCAKCKMPYRVNHREQKVGEALWKRHQ